MKTEKRKQARRLRKEGKSVREITKILNVSKGSISRWVRDISLTSKQVERLNKRHKLSKADYKKIAELNRKRAREKRKEYQEKGKALLKKSDEMFVAGIMLFWAEGNKCKNAVIFCNTEPAMMSFFIKFLRKYFNIDEKKFKFCFQWYSNNEMTKEDVANYWSGLLEITKDQMNKSYVDYRPVKNMGRKKGKCPFGVCRLILNDTKIVHMLYGAIQEYIGFKNERWLF